MERAPAPKERATTMAKQIIRITHTPTNTNLAEGPRGWGMTPFEGNYYIRKKYLRTSFKPSFIPGICVYKFFYVWMDLVLTTERIRGLGWLYFLPNPLFPFIWFRVAVPGSHPDLAIEEFNQLPDAADQAGAAVKLIGANRRLTLSYGQRVEEDVLSPVTFPSRSCHGFVQPLPRRLLPKERC